jgi:hypothetical protein
LGGIAAGQVNQGFEAIAIGAGAGGTDQVAGAIAIGIRAAENTQSQQSIAIGDNAGNGAGPAVQGFSSIAIGKFTSSTGTTSIAIGTSAEAAGDNSIAIGQGAGKGGLGALAGLGDRSIEISTRTNQSRVGNVAGQLVFNTSSTGIPGNASNVVSDFIVQTTGLASGVGVQPGGLLDVANGGAPVSAPTTADFDHYLVYNSRTGQIRICPV